LVSFIAWILRSPDSETDDVVVSIEVDPVAVAAWKEAIVNNGTFNTTIPKNK